MPAGARLRVAVQQQQRRARRRRSRGRPRSPDLDRPALRSPASIAGSCQSARARDFAVGRRPPTIAAMTRPSAYVADAPPARRAAPTRSPRSSPSPRPGRASIVVAGEPGPGRRATAREAAARLALDGAVAHLRGGAGARASAPARGGAARGGPHARPGAARPGCARSSCCWATARASRGSPGELARRLARLAGAGAAHRARARRPTRRRWSSTASRPRTTRRAGRARDPGPRAGRRPRDRASSATGCPGGSCRSPSRPAAGAAATPRSRCPTTCAPRPGAPLDAARRAGRATWRAGSRWSPSPPRPQALARVCRRDPARIERGLDALVRRGRPRRDPRRRRSPAGRFRDRIVRGGRPRRPRRRRSCGGATRRPSSRAAPRATTPGRAAAPRRSAPPTPTAVVAYGTRAAIAAREATATPRRRSRTPPRALAWWSAEIGESRPPRRPPRAGHGPARPVAVGGGGRDARGGRRAAARELRRARRRRSRASPPPRARAGTSASTTWRCAAAGPPRAQPRSRPAARRPRARRGAHPGRGHGGHDLPLRRRDGASRARRATEASAAGRRRDLDARADLHGHGRERAGRPRAGCCTWPAPAARASGRAARASATRRSR